MQVFTIKQIYFVLEVLNFLVINALHNKKYMENYFSKRSYY